MFIGLAIWVAAAPVVFFLPAGMKMGSQGTFLTVILAPPAMGLRLMLSGQLIRGEPEEWFMRRCWSKTGVRRGGSREPGTCVPGNGFMNRRVPSGTTLFRGTKAWQAPSS